MYITVIIPTFKRIDYLSQAIASVCNQTHTDFECLIINDYPPDQAKLSDLIAHFADSRLRLINHTQSSGGNTARNTGIQQASGEIIAFLDDDDWWEPNKLRLHLQQHQEQDQVGVVFSGLTKRWRDNIIPDKIIPAYMPEQDIVIAMRQGRFCPPSTSGVTVLRECFSQCGLFDEQLASFQDWDMWYRIAQQYSFTNIEQSLVLFRQHLGDRTSKTVSRRLQGLEQISEKWCQELENIEQFKTIFIKEAYACATYNSILRKQRIIAIQDWYQLFKSSRHLSDFILLFKLIVMWSISAQNYGRLSKFSSSF